MDVKKDGSQVGIRASETVRRVGGKMSCTCASRSGGESKEIHKCCIRSRRGGPTDASVSSGLNVSIPCSLP